MADILYTSIDGENSFEFEEKRSIFIGYAKQVSTEEQAKEFISEIKVKHHDARHNCSAFLLRNGTMRYSDDGEPQGTAGIPILEVIKKSGIVDVVVVVTRYFGGILLGAGGLVRAYSSAASGVLSESKKVNYQKCVSFCVTLEYPQYEKLTRLMNLNGVRITDTDFNDKITLFAVTSADKYDDFCNSLTEMFAAKVCSQKIDDLIEKI